MQRTESTEAVSIQQTASERLQRIFWNNRGMQREVFQSMSSSDNLVVVINAYRCN
jgi:hypothetical protein